MSYKRIKEVLKRSNTSASSPTGIEANSMTMFFNRLQINGSLPSDITEMSAFQLGLAYLNHSGNKIVTEMVIDEIGYSEEEESDYAVTLADIVGGMFAQKWERISEALFAEYNPVENYDKSSTITTINNGKDSVQYGSQMNSSTIGGGTDTYSHNTAPYDSSTLVPETQDSNVIAQRSNSNTIGTHTDETTYGHTVTVVEDTHGNIGVMAGADLVEKEARIRSEYQLFDIIFKDIDSVLALKCY